jgi:hypothetical protein
MLSSPLITLAQNRHQSYWRRDTFACHKINNGKDSSKTVKNIAIGPGRPTCKMEATLPTPPIKTEAQITRKRPVCLSILGITHSPSNPNET